MLAWGYELCNIVPTSMYVFGKAMNTRQKLLLSARQLLREVGYESMSPAMVLKHSGAGQGSLYHHFTGKQDLARQALEEVREELTRDIMALFDDDALTGLEKLQLYLGKTRSGLEGCKLGRLSNEQALREGVLHQPLEDYFSVVLQRVAQALEQAIAQGDLPGDLPVDEVAQMVVAAVQGGYVTSRATRDGAAVNRATAGALAVLDMLARREKGR